MTSTESTLIDVLSKGLKLKRPSPITPQTAIFGKNVTGLRPPIGAPADGLGLDSVDVLEIAVLLDKHFGVILEEQNEEVHQALATIGSLAAFIDRHQTK